MSNGMCLFYGRKTWDMNWIKSPKCDCSLFRLCVHLVVAFELIIFRLRLMSNGKPELYQIFESSACQWSEKTFRYFWIQPPYERGLRICLKPYLSLSHMRTLILYVNVLPSVLSHKMLGENEGKKKEKPKKEKNQNNIQQHKKSIIKISYIGKHAT